MDFFYSALVVVEIMLVSFALYSLIRKHLDYRISSSVTLSMAGTLIIYSFVLQIIFLTVTFNALFLIEILIALISLCIIIKNYKFYLNEILKLLESPSFRFTLIICFFPFFYLFLQSFLLRPNNCDSLVYNLSRSLLYEDAGTLFPQSISDYAHVSLPLGNDLLYYLFLRFDGENGLAFFGYFSYIGSILGVYSLVRNYHSGKTSIASALLFACLPEIVFHATTPKNDLAVVFFALCSLIAFSKLYVKRSISSLVLLILFLAGGLSSKSTFFAFALPFFLIFILWAFRSNMLSTSWSLIKRQPLISLTLGFIVLIMSQIWLFAYNVWAWGTWSGPPIFVNGNVNQDGLLGALVNLCRYFLESLHLTQPFNFISEKFFGFSLPSSLNNLYNHLLLPLWGDIALAQPFSINWSQTEDTWYGPVGFLVAWIGAPYALISRKSPAKWISILAFSFLFIIAYKINWWSSNQRYLACFFALSIVASAPLLEKILKYKVLSILIYTISILIGLHSILFNVTKPFFHFLTPRVDLMLKDSLIDGTNVWNQTQFGQETWWPHPLGNWGELNLDGKTVGIIASNHHNHFDFIKTHPSTKFVGLSHDRGLPKERYERIFSNDKLKVKEVDFLLTLNVAHKIIEEHDCSKFRIFTPIENTVKEVPILPLNHSLQEYWHFKPNESCNYVLYKICTDVQTD